MAVLRVWSAHASTSAYAACEAVGCGDGGFQAAGGVVGAERAALDGGPTVVVVTAVAVVVTAVAVVVPIALVVVTAVDVVVPAVDVVVPAVEVVTAPAPPVVVVDV
jgi:hypothetical protein